MQAVDNKRFTMAAILSQEIHVALTQLLHGLQSPDNVLRTEAEQKLQNEWSDPQPGLLLVGLVEQLQGADDVAVCPTLFPTDLLLTYLLPRLARSPLFSSAESPVEVAKTPPPPIQARE